MRAGIRGEVWLYALQRGSALVLAPLVFIHLALIIYAVRSGLSAAAILSRTHGSLFWAGFYGLFVAAASLHAAIGLRAILREWAQLRPPHLGWIVTAFGLLLLAIGVRAVAAVIL